MNPNFNTNPQKGYKWEQKDMNAHSDYVWKTYIAPSRFTKLQIIAHSAGGTCLTSIIKKNKATFFQQVDKIAYTDSYPIKNIDLDFNEKKLMLQKSINFVKSNNLPLGAPVQDTKKEKSCCKLISAGHPHHSYSTGCGWPAIKSWFEGKK